MANGACEETSIIFKIICNVDARLYFALLCFYNISCMKN